MYQDLATWEKVSTFIDDNMKKRLITWLLCSMLLPVQLLAEDEHEIIEHLGDRYVIHVDAMHPDMEMTLMDVLQACPELLSPNGKLLHPDYELCIDNVTLSLDYETVLEALKASDISTVEVYYYTSLYTGGAGRFGSINISLKPQADGTTSGKLLLEGSTRGNGKAYTDVVAKSGNVSVRGYALGNMKYARGPLTDYDSYSMRMGIENVHLDVDWDISEQDNLKVKLFQNFDDSKQRIFDGEGGTEVYPEIERFLSGVANYTHTLNDRGANIVAESGVEYLNATIENISQRDCYTYFFAETTQPLTDALSMLAGWEIDYYNMWAAKYDRQHTMYNDLYLQLDYGKGPWVLTLGDRLRFVNYWHRTYNIDDTSLWSHNRTEHSFLASAGYKTGRHFVQGLFNRDYYTPGIVLFYGGYDEVTRRRRYLTDVQTTMAYSAEARYTYQQKDLVVSGSVVHQWDTKNAAGKNQCSGLRASATWHKGPFRLTAGADYYHAHVGGTADDPDKYDNYFHLRLQPALLLHGGLRISSRLLYSSRQDLLYSSPAHLYASVKVSKDLGHHCTVSANFHDLAGSPRMSFVQLGNSCDNRAVTFSLTCRL